MRTDLTAQPGERKLLTVLFADLRGSLSVISGRDPEQADEILSDVISVMLKAVFRNGGTVTRVMGDGIMALFGAPHAIEHHAARACMAALEMRQAVIDGQASMTHKLDFPIGLRIGINSGEVVVKRIDSGGFAGYEANGEVVHVANRMEQMAPENGIVLGADTARLVTQHFDLRPLPQTGIKGLALPLDVFELAGDAARVARPAPFRADDFVSRTEEIAAITEARRQAAAGRGGVVWVRGEAGLGKSRLVHEALQRNADTRRIASAQAHPFRNSGYQLIADLVASSLGFDLSIARTIDLGALRASVSALGAPALVSPLAAIFGLDPIDREWAVLTPTERRTRMQAAVCQLIIRLAARHSWTLVAEDLHWIDPESQQVLDRLVQLLPATSVLLVVTSRPEWRCPWGAPDWLRELTLAPLAERDISALLARRLEGAHAASLGAMLSARAGGNPLFAEMLLSGLTDEGVLLDLGSRYHTLRDAPPAQLPATIRGLMAERIDRLPADDKHLLQAAAVIGPRVPLDLLARVTDVAPERFTALLQRLRSNGFLDPAEGTEEVVVFHHELMREAIYAALLLRSRREIHGRVVDLLLALDDAQKPAFFEDLAEHARHAERWDEAARFAALAAQKALARDANAQAAYFLRAAVNCVVHWPQNETRTALELDLHLAFRDPLFRLGRIDEIAEHLARAAELIDERTDWRKRGLFHVQSGHVFSLRGNSDGSLAECAKALELAQLHGDTALAARAQVQQGLELFQRWEFAPAIAAFDSAWAYISVHTDDLSYGLQRGLDVAVLSFATRARAELGRFAEAERAVPMLLDLAESRDRAFEKSFAYMAIGHLHEARAEPIEARPWLERAETSCRTGDMPLLALVPASHLGLVMVRGGDVTAGLAKLQATHSQITTMGFRGQLSYCLAALAEAYLLARDPASARTAAEQAIEVAVAQNDVGSHAQALLVLSQCVSAQGGGGIDRETELLSTAIRMAERLSLRPLAARCRAHSTCTAESGQGP